MKITITMDEAIDFIKQALALPYDYELEIDKIQLKQEPVKDIDWAMVERERVRQVLRKAQEGFSGKGKIRTGENMRSPVVLSFVEELGGIPHILDYPAYQWFGTTYQEEHDAKEAEEAAAKAKAEKERIEAARAKLQAEVDANNRKLFEIQRSERYAKLKAKYGNRCDDYEQWKIWEEEEEEFERKKKNEAEDIKFYQDAGIPLPFTPQYQEASSIFKIDGMSHEEYAAKMEADRIAADKEHKETMAILEANPDLVNQMAGAEPSSLFKQLEEAKKAMDEPKPITNSIFQSVDKPKEVISEPEEEEVICIPTGEPATSLFAGLAPIKDEEEPKVELKEEIPVFMQDDVCPWADDQPVLV